MIQWFTEFPEFAEITEFNEISTPFKEHSNPKRADAFDICLMLDSNFLFFGFSGDINI